MQQDVGHQTTQHSSCERPPTFTTGVALSFSLIARYSAAWRHLGQLRTNYIDAGWCWASADSVWGDFAWVAEVAPNNRGKTKTWSHVFTESGAGMLRWVSSLIRYYVLVELCGSTGRWQSHWNLSNRKMPSNAINADDKLNVDFRYTRRHIEHGKCGLCSKCIIEKWNIVIVIWSGTSCLSLNWST